MTDLIVHTLGYNEQKSIPSFVHDMVSQTKGPTKLILHDNGSVDNTVEIFENSARDAGLSFLSSRNPANVGAPQNFRKVFYLGPTLSKYFYELAKAKKYNKNKSYNNFAFW